MVIVMAVCRQRLQSNGAAFARQITIDTEFGLAQHLNMPDIKPVLTRTCNRERQIPIIRFQLFFGIDRKIRCGRDILVRSGKPDLESIMAEIAMSGTFGSIQACKITLGNFE